MKHFLSQYKQIEDRLQTLRSVLTFCFGIGYIANVFLAQPLLALINTIMLVLAVILSFIATKGSTRMIAAVLLFVGAFLLIYAQAPLDVWEKSALGEWLPAGNVHHGSAHQLAGALRRLQRIA